MVERLRRCQTLLQEEKGTDGMYWHAAFRALRSSPTSSSMCEFVLFSKHNSFIVVCDSVVSADKVWSFPFVLFPLGVSQAIPPPGEP